MNFKLALRYGWPTAAGKLIVINFIPRVGAGAANFGIRKLAAQKRLSEKLELANLRRSGAEKRPDV